MQYLFKDEWLDAEVGEESFKFLGEDEGSDTSEEVAEVVRTHHGPVITGGPDSGWGVALADPGSEDATPWVDSALAAMKSRNADEFEAALAGWTDRVNNYPYADIHGEFGYCLKGRVPMRSFVNAFGPVPGWTGEHEWQGYIPPHQMPRVRNPETGWVVTCNQRVVGDDYPFWLAASFGPDYRARRIITLIESHIERGQRIAPADMREFHADTVSINGLSFKAWLASRDTMVPEDVPPELRDVQKNYEEAVNAILKWDGRMDRESEAALIWADIAEHLALELMPSIYDIDHNILLEQPGVFACAYDHYRKNVNPNFMIGLQHIARVGDQDEVMLSTSLAARAALAKACFIRDIRKMSRQFENADDPDAPSLSTLPVNSDGSADATPATWGDAHMAAQKHPLHQHGADRFKQLGDVLNAPGISVGGYEDVPLATGGNRGLNKDALTGPVNRYLHDPSDWANGRWIVPLGVSGNSGSPHFTDQQQRWADVDYVPQLYDWDEIAQSAESVQHFTP